MQGLKLETLNLKDGALRLALTLHVLGLGVLFRHYFRLFSPWEGQPYAHFPFVEVGLVSL
jgi:hypothetical protein